MSQVRSQCCAASAACARLQSNFLRTLALPDSARHWSLTMLNQDWRQDHPARALCHVPDGRGRNSERSVRRHPMSHRAAQAEATSHMLSERLFMRSRETTGASVTSTSGNIGRDNGLSARNPTASTPSSSPIVFGLPAERFSVRVYLIGSTQFQSWIITPELLQNSDKSLILGRVYAGYFTKNPLITLRQHTICNAEAGSSSLPDSLEDVPLVTSFFHIARARRGRKPASKFKLTYFIVHAR